MFWFLECLINYDLRSSNFMLKYNDRSVPHISRKLFALLFYLGHIWMVISIDGVCIRLLKSV